MINYTFSDIVKLIMKDTGKGYSESAQALDKVVADREAAIRIAAELTSEGND
jgi:hypothetical protein